MPKKLIAFDLDETLTETRTLITDNMAQLMIDLLKKFQVCVISGGSIEQFKKQLLANLKTDPTVLSSLHLMPTCGTRYYAYDLKNNDWLQIYAEDLSNQEKKTIISTIDEAIEAAGYKIDNPAGPLVEDRGSQITYSALGQNAQAAVKKAWDPTGEKKRKIRDIISNKIPQFEVRVGGTTSIDVTKLGIDKAYGMKKLMDVLGLGLDEMLFIGDRIFEGGNDYPVKLMGVDTVAVDGYEQTPWVVRGILAVS